MARVTTGFILADDMRLLLICYAVFMGKPTWLKNPHLRARLAESLECLLPHHQTQVLVVVFCGDSSHRKQLVSFDTVFMHRGLGLFKTLFDDNFL